MNMLMRNFFKGKRILVTGGTGTVGSALVRELMKLNPRVIRILSNDEDGLYNLSNELRRHHLKLRYLLGDVRDKDRLNLAMQNIDIVYHSAALKHVPLCEYNPFEGVKTNVIGTQNAIEMATKNNVKKFIFISTDKSVEPVNTMGATKLLGERLTIDANHYRGPKNIKFSCVRFGNILNSRGSVIPLWIKQIGERKALTITDKKMTRFIISIGESTSFILKATLLMKGGEVFIYKNMKAVKIFDLIIVIRDVYSKKFGLKPHDINIKMIGRRPGEKLHEPLMTEEEAENALETKDLFIVLPYKNRHHKKISVSQYKGAKYTNEKYFSSKDVAKLTRQEIRQLVKNL